LGDGGLFFYALLIDFPLMGAARPPSPSVFSGMDH